MTLLIATLSYFSSFCIIIFCFQWYIFQWQTLMPRTLWCHQCSPESTGPSLTMIRFAQAPAFTNLQCFDIYKLAQSSWSKSGRTVAKDELILYSSHVSSLCKTWCLIWWLPRKSQLVHSHCFSVVSRWNHEIPAYPLYGSTIPKLLVWMSPPLGFWIL